MSKNRKQELAEANDRSHNEIPKDGRIITPTNDRRHITAVREGRISAEVFCRDPERREQLGLPAIIVDED